MYCLHVCKYTLAVQCPRSQIPLELKLQIVVSHHVGAGNRTPVLCYSGQCFCRAWWCAPLILAHGRQRQVDLFEFKARLVYIVSSRSAGATRRPCLKKKNCILDGRNQTQKTTYCMIPVRNRASDMAYWVKALAQDHANLMN